jgi:hypothetical protein
MEKQHRHGSNLKNQAEILDVINALDELKNIIENINSRTDQTEE